MQIVEPEVGCWYKNVTEDVEFEVVAIEEGTDCIEIQYYDGDLEEVEREFWYQLELTYVSPPDNWSGAFELDPEDINQVEVVIRPESWNVLDCLQIDVDDDEFNFDT